MGIFKKINKILEIISKYYIGVVEVVESDYFVKVRIYYYDKIGGHKKFEAVFDKERYERYLKRDLERHFGKNFINYVKV